MAMDNVTRRGALGGMVGAAVATRVNSAEIKGLEAADMIEVKRIFIDIHLADAEAATQPGQFFKLIDTEAGVATIYRRKTDGSDMLYQELDAVALAAAEQGKGAALVGWRHSADLATRTVDSKLRELPVSIMDAESADPTGSSDSTAAIQSAYEKAQSTGRALYVPDGRFLCKRIIINNRVTYSRSEKVIKIYGPGTIINTNTESAMITSEKGVGGASGMLIFKDITFEESEGASALVDGDMVRRIIFDSVFFNRIGCCVYADEYLQSAYFSACIVRGGGAGRWFIDVNNLFDVRFLGNIIEHRGSFLRTRSATADPAANSLVINNNLIEGLVGKALQLGACYATSITDNYFEGNTVGDIDCGISTAFHKGLTIQGNSFQPHPNLLARSEYYPIIWGKVATGGVSSGGNSSTGNLHDTRGSAAMVDMTGDYAGGMLYSGYASPKTVGRTPEGYAEYSQGPSKCLAVSDRLMRLDPFSRGIAYQGGAYYGSEVSDEIAPVWHLLGTANPGLSPGNYANRKWGRGSYVWNVNPREAGEEGARYLVRGWSCIRAGQGGHATGTDRWVEDRGLTGG